jgi:MoxR-like ATPase
MSAPDPRTLVEGWLRHGRAQVVGDTIQVSAPPPPSLAARLRRAYDWIAQSAIHCPYDDIELGGALHVRGGELQIELRGDQSFSSFLLLPLLTLVTSRRLLFVGAPGRGKTTVATLMALLAGASREEARRAIQHGHPQLTVADLLGGPLPSALIQAQRADELQVSWRGWIQGRVKIIDEYNRIPTKTQSALLSLMAEGYAEMYEQVIEAGRSAWFLTANDDLGGGTFEVIEALRDRIDVVVRCTPFHSRFLDALVERVEAASSPEEFVPRDLIFTPQELDEMEREVRAVPISGEVRALLGFWMGQLDFCRRASNRLEYMNKDTLHLSGRRVGHVCTEDCPLDKQENLCTQTESGVSARAYQSLIHYAKALAWFRGAAEVGAEELRQLAPWILHEKLKPNAHSAFFQKVENQVYLVDKVSWIQQLFDRAAAQRAAYEVTRGPIAQLQRELEEGLEALTASELRQRMGAARRQMELCLQRSELNGPVYEDLVLLKNLYYRYQEAARRRGMARGV